MLPQFPEEMTLGKRVLLSISGFIFFPSCPFGGDKVHIYNANM